MTIRRRIAIVATVPLALILLAVLTLLFVPDRELQGLVARGLAQEGYSFKAARLGKSFPLGVAARDVHIATGAGEVLRADTLSVQLRLLPLFAGRLVLAFGARIGSGTVRAELQPWGKGKMTLEITGLRLQDIPFFVTVAGARLQGELKARAAFAGRGPGTTGELKLEIRGAEVGGVKIGELPLPDAAYRNVQGMLRASGGKLLLESFTLEGDGIYARLKGDIPLQVPLASAPLNLTLELMPKAELLEKQKFVFLLLVKYLTSPGHYEIPIRGVLAKPAVV